MVTPATSPMVEPVSLGPGTELDMQDTAEPAVSDAVALQK